MRALRRNVLTLLLPAVLAAAGLAPAAADDKRHRKDHEEARQAVERGEIMPLTEVLAEVRKSVPGEIVGVELERKHGTWVYEFKVIQTGGLRIEVYTDARPGRIIRTKDK